MKTRSLLAALSVLMLLFAFGSSVRADGPPPQPASPEGQDSVTTLVNDRTITIRSQADIEAKRLALRQFIWGTDTLPTQLPTTVTRNVASPVRGLTNLARVDDLHITMEDSVQGLAHHFIPQRPNNRLVIVHGGHDCTFDAAPSYADTDIGLQRTISQLLIDGYGVLAVYMPHYLPGDCRLVSHDSLFSLPLRNGNALKFFLDPTAVSLNYLKTRADADGFPRYQDYNMIGLSGGGWTTTLYAAVDPTIKTSIPVAGTLPLYLRYDGYNHDLEQTLSSFYSRAGYPDLYVLGSYGRGRKQVQVLNRHDNCCFGEAEHRVSPTGMTWEQAVRDYEARVRLALYNIGAYQGYGSFRVEIDEAAPAHMISWNAIVNTILPELNGGRRYSGAVGRDAFYRGVNGHLWHNSPSGETDTGLPMVGVPAALQGVLYSFDVFYRDPSNRLMRAFRTTSGWTTRSMGGAIISDPVVVSPAPGRFDVVAFGSDYRLYQWSGTPSGDSPPRQIGGSAIGQGTPSLVTRGPNQLDVFFRGFDRSIYHLQTGDGATWSVEGVGGVSLDFPSSVALPDGSLRVYARGQDSQLWEARPVKGSIWQWATVSGQTGGQTVYGSPSAAVLDETVRVQVRTGSNTLATFAYSGRWTFTSYFSLITGSPTATSAGAFVRNGDASLAFYYGTGGDWRGGIFD